MNEGKSREEEGGRRQRLGAQFSPSNRSLDLGGKDASWEGIFGGHFALSQRCMNKGVNSNVG